VLRGVRRAWFNGRSPDGGSSVRGPGITSVVRLSRNCLVVECLVIECVVIECLVGAWHGALLTA
jgi:hypothetical protein